MSLEKLNTEVRQEQIARAAFGIVASQGMRRLSVESVARRIGLVPSAIYRHFKNKDAMLQAVLEHIRQLLLGNVAAVCDETANPVDRLRRLLFRHIGMIRENQAIPRIVFSEDIFGGPPRRKKAVYGIVQEYLQKVEEIIRQGQQERKIRAELDPRTLSVMFLGLIQSSGVLWLMSEGRFDVTGHAQRAWKVFGEILEAK